MKRISVFLRKDQIDQLDRIAVNKNISHAELIREAIDYKLFTELKKSSKNEILQNSHGILKRRLDGNIESGTIIETIRSEWEQRHDRNKE